MPFPYSPLSLAYPLCNISSLSHFSSHPSILNANSTTEDLSFRNRVIRGTTVKAAVVLLTGPFSADVVQVQQALLSFHQRINLPLQRNYPALIVYGKEEWANATRDVFEPIIEAMAISAPGLVVRFVPHVFRFPNGFDPNVTRDGQITWAKRSRWGYHHMCRFWFRTIWEKLEIREFDYIMRLDTDSVIHTRFDVDPFLYMHHRNIDYAYLSADSEHAIADRRLWRVTSKFRFAGRQPEFNFRGVHFPDDVTMTKMKEQENLDFIIGPRVPTFNNNFEIDRVAFFTDNQGLLAFTRYIDEEEPFGQFTYRWGDAPLRFLSVALFGSESNTLLIDCVYFHNGYTNIRSISQFSLGHSNFSDPFPRGFNLTHPFKTRLLFSSD